jgi:hypothetical protein
MRPNPNRLAGAYFFLLRPMLTRATILEIVLPRSGILLFVWPLAALPQSAQDSLPPPPLPVIHSSIVITATPLGPQFERRNAAAFQQTLFSRDDQVFHLLDAGINAGQHEGGGKSLEVRRFGFNLDHGGVNMGLRVMVDNVPQNHSTQGHGQGYLGSLKTLIPELVDEVDVINGPFSAEYGDYSGLGAVHIRLRESLPDALTLRFQGGSFDTARGFIAWSPNLRERDAIFAYEGSYSNGPFLKPLNYRRDNVSGNYTWRAGPDTRFGLKWNGGLNRFSSSGQIPTDEVFAGRLSPFGCLSDGDGGYVQGGRLASYWRRELNGSVLKLDGFLERSLFDLYSNFTFFLNDPERGDAIQQHDSRLSQGANLQYLRPQTFGWGAGLLTLGGNFLASQNNVDLRSRLDRNPLEMLTAAHARVSSGGGYIQESLELAGRRLQLGGGFRFDVFHYGLTDSLEPDLTGSHGQTRLQPKAHLSYTPSHRVPARLFFHYGRGIASIDARGAVRRPDGPFLNTNDFLQFGATQRFSRFWIENSFFLIQNSHQLVYIPDDGSIEFSDPSRAYGFEVKTSFQVTSSLAFHGGVTKVLDAYYRGVAPRVYLDSAPHFVSNAALTLSRWKGWTGSLRMRAINRYRLDGEDPSIRASGHTVFDFALSRRIHRNLDLNFAMDNLFDRFHWETQNYFTSRLPGQEPLDRVHATPGYGRTITAGVTFRIGGK